MLINVVVMDAEAAPDTSSVIAPNPPLTPTDFLLPTPPSVASLLTLPPVDPPVTPPEAVEDRDDECIRVAWGMPPYAIIMLLEAVVEVLSPLMVVPLGLSMDVVLEFDGPLTVIEMFEITTQSLLPELPVVFPVEFVVVALDPEAIPTVFPISKLASAVAE